jgi:sulfate adenylyltransferase subunit 2
MNSALSAHLKRLEAESIYIIREVAAEFRNPVMLYSIGKDSGALVHLALKAFYPAKPPFPLLHVDTTWKFRDMIAFRDKLAADLGLNLIIYTNQDGVDRGVSPVASGSSLHTQVMKTEALKQALDKYGFDAAFGGARRDEEKSRAKERIFSFRNENHAWDPRNQRPELWSLYNGRHTPGQHVRAFPISNWTELDVWRYIERESIPLPPLYFAHEREVYARDGMWRAVGEYSPARPGEKIERRTVRYRTVGDMSCTGAVESDAADLPSIVSEVGRSTLTERGATRGDDRISEAAMEDRKKDGYF